MNASTFTIIGEPTRLEILNALRQSDLAVGELVDLLVTSQPTISKHLKVLRDAGYVRCTVDAQRRIYQLNDQPFRQIDAWLEPYRDLWNDRLDALASFLDEENGEPEKTCNENITEEQH